MHALLAGLDDTAAASAANVQRPTLNRWKNHDADFISAMNIARRDLADCFFDGLRALYGDAVAVIRDALNAENPPAVRLRAAEAIIKTSCRPMAKPTPRPSVLVGRCIKPMSLANKRSPGSRCR